MLLPHSPWSQLVPELCPCVLWAPMSSSDSGLEGFGKVKVWAVQPCCPGVGCPGTLNWNAAGKEGKRNRGGCQRKHNQSQPQKFSPALKANLNSVNNSGSAFALISPYNPFSTIRSTITNTLLQVRFFSRGIPIQLKDFPSAPVISASGLGITFLTRVWL